MWKFVPVKGETLAINADGILIPAEEVLQLLKDLEHGLHISNNREMFEPTLIRAQEMIAKLEQLLGKSDAHP